MSYHESVGSAKTGGFSMHFQPPPPPPPKVLMTESLLQMVEIMAFFVSCINQFPTRGGGR